ncbi:hypothetical protein [uncultured Bacteroides sp.]|uniref:hypothetical protein n=1 Tax=uncultured Bacteroides sp. TaxID=162156 RepID=UPI00280B1100|nr:hypothetical protein [uncultured Bacteroides sp.]
MPKDIGTPDSIISNQNKTDHPKATPYLKIKRAFIWQTLSIAVAISCVFIGNYLAEKRESRIGRKLGDSILIAMKQDFKTSINELDTVIRKETDVILYSYELNKAFANPSKYMKDTMLITYITRGAMSYYRAKINLSSYETLVNYGNINIVKDIGLLHDLSSLYTYVKSAWEDGEYSFDQLMEFNKECSKYLPEFASLKLQKEKGIAPVIPDSVRIRIIALPVNKIRSRNKVLEFLSNKKAQGFLMVKTTLKVNYLNYLYEVRSRLIKAQNLIDNYINPIN